MRIRIFISALLMSGLLVASLLVSGCGAGSTDTGEAEGRPESVTAYQVVQLTKPAATKWQSQNWMVQLRDGDPDGVARDGKAKIWEVYFFSPRPEEDSQLLVIYNRGNVWPQTPGANKGGDQGLGIYRKGKPQDFRVDSGEAYRVALRNGGGDFLDSHAGAQVHLTLRCKADYDAIGEAMPAPKYKWIWDVAYRVPVQGSEVLHVMVDGMNGDFITKELKQTG